jgi:hypothetical protein
VWVGARRFDGRRWGVDVKASRQVSSRTGASGGSYGRLSWSLSISSSMAPARVPEEGSSSAGGPGRSSALPDERIDHQAVGDLLNPGEIGDILQHHLMLLLAR